MKLHPHPGPKPTHLNEKGQFVCLPTAEFCGKQAEIRQWESAMLQYGFQQMRIDKAVKREEVRQDNIRRFNLDPVQATIAHHQKHGIP